MFPRVSPYFFSIPSKSLQCFPVLLHLYMRSAMFSKYSQCLFGIPSSILPPPHTRVLSYSLAFFRVPSVIPRVPPIFLGPSSPWHSPRLPPVSPPSFSVFPRLPPVFSCLPPCPPCVSLAFHGLPMLLPPFPMIPPFSLSFCHVLPSSPVFSRLLRLPLCSPLVFLRVSLVFPGLPILHPPFPFRPVFPPSSPRLPLVFPQSSPRFPCRSPVYPVFPYLPMSSPVFRIFTHVPPEFPLVDNVVCVSVLADDLCYTSVGNLCLFYYGNISTKWCSFNCTTIWVLQCLHVDLHVGLHVGLHVREVADVQPGVVANLNSFSNNDR